MKTIMVYQTDPFGDDQGGGVRYVNNLLEGIQPYMEEILFLGAGKAEREKNGIVFLPLVGQGVGYVIFLWNILRYCMKSDLSRYDVVHVHRLYFAIPFILFHSRLNIVCTLHGQTFAVFRARLGKFPAFFAEPVFKIVEKYCLARISKIAPVSTAVLETFSAKYPATLSRRKDDIKIIPSMVDLSRFSPRPSDYFQKIYGEEFKYIVFLGRLAHVKNIEFLLETWASPLVDKVQNRLVLVGGGECKEALEAMAQNLGLQRSVIFHGVITADDVPACINSSSGLVLCSHHEASPTVIKESLACGVPVISTDVGDAADYILDGQSGMLIDYEVQSFETAIHWLLGLNLDKNRIKAVAEDGLKRATVKGVSEEYVKLYGLSIESE